MAKKKSPTLLNLICLNNDDLNVVSAQLQDAVAQVGDISFSPAEKRFVILFNRFNWDETETKKPERRRSALRFEFITGVKSRNIMRTEKSAVLNLLSIQFDETVSPSGTITLYFSGGGEIALEADCLEGQLNDLGPKWRTATKPSHKAEL